MSSNLTKFVNDFVAISQKQFSNNNIANNELIGKVALGYKVSNEEYELGNMQLKSIDNALDQTLSLMISNEEYQGFAAGLTEAQKRAAQFIAPLAHNPKEYVAKMGSLNVSKLPVVSSESIGVEGIADVGIISNEARVALESYDGQKLNNFIYFNMAFNLAAAKQDEFGEAFFPTITVDPTQSGLDVSIELASVYNEFTRSITGSSDKDKFARKSVIKSVFDDTTFGSNKNRVIPVYRESENKDKFLADLKYTNKETGVEIVTAPLKLGQTISLLGISATDEMLAKGALDNTDALDRPIILTSLYYSLTGNAKEYFKLDTSIYGDVNKFRPAQQEHHKDMMLQFGGQYSVNISSIKTATGAENTVWAAIAAKAANYVAVFDFSVSGSANTETSDIEVNVVKFALKEVRNAAGQIIPTTDAIFTEVLQLVETIRAEGFTVDATRTNSNIRTRGVLVTTDRYEYNYPVEFRSGVTALLPVNNATGTDNGAEYVASQILLTGLFVSNQAVSTLLNYADSMKVAKENGTLGIGFGAGLAKHIVDPYFSSDSFELTSSVDSINSSDRMEDIRLSLINNIRTEVMKMYLESNYGVAFDVIRGSLGGKITVIIGTDPLIKSLLVRDNATFPLDADFEATVVATKNPKLKNKIIITFGIFDANRNSAVNPLNFGNCLWSPTITYEVPKTTNNAVSREFHCNPRFTHIINLPILSVFNVSGIQQAFGKIAVYNKVQ